MTEEEKKAIELLENIKNDAWTTKYIMSSDSKNAEVLLNLVEKLQKENEEYSKQLDLDYVDKNFIPIKDIKGKIEALDVLITNLGYDEDAPDEYKNDIDREIFLLTRDKRTLQELIGEEE